MTDLIIKLIEKCISLIKRKEEVNRDLFSDFVQPIQDDFDKVHNNYLESFKKYREMMSEIEHPISENSNFLTTITEDSVFSYHDRSKLISLDYYCDHIQLGKYLKAIHNYLCLSSDVYPNQFVTLRLEGDPKELWRKELHRNAPRYYSVDQIIEAQKEQNLNKEKYKEKAINALSKVVTDLQDNYEKVYKEFIDLKMKLLSKI